MGYIYDEAMAEGLPYRFANPIARSPEEVMANATVVHVDSAVTYWEFLTPPEDYIGIDDMPNLTPIVRSLWLEPRVPWSGFRPEDIASAGAQEGMNEDAMWREGVWHWAMLIDAVDLLSDVGKEEVWEILELQLGDRVYSPEVRWCLSIYLVAMSPFDVVPKGPLIWWLLPIRADGTIEPHMTGGGPSIPAFPLNPEIQEFSLQRVYADSAVVYLRLALFAFSALNSPQTRLRPDPQRNKTYDLDMDQLKHTLTAVGKAPEFGMRRALHTCRDYFHRTS